MTDGPATATDPDKIAANKALVRLRRRLPRQWPMEKLAGYFDGDNYVQHNPQIADQLSGLGAALQSMAQAGVTMKYDRIHKCWAKAISCWSRARASSQEDRPPSTICSGCRTAGSPSIGTRSKPFRLGPNGRMSTASSDRRAVALQPPPGGFSLRRNACRTTSNATSTTHRSRADVLDSCRQVQVQNPLKGQYQWPRVRQ
jgi:hypothetical protein